MYNFFNRKDILQAILKEFNETCLHANNGCVVLNPKLKSIWRKYKFQKGILAIFFSWFEKKSFD